MEVRAVSHHRVPYDPETLALTTAMQQVLSVIIGNDSHRSMS